VSGQVCWHTVVDGVYDWGAVVVKKLFRSFLVALSVLTRLPAPPLAAFSVEEKGRGLAWFPIIGALMGMLLALTAWALRGVEPILASVILLTAWLFVSELHHLDALAKCVSGWMFGEARGDGEDKSAPAHLGIVGVIALIMMMKFSALAVLIEYNGWVYIFLVPIIARLLVFALIGFTPAAKDEALTNEFRIDFPYVFLFLWLLMAIPLALVVGVPMFALFVTLLLIRLRVMYCTGGLTWEAIGATIVLLEAVGLFAAALMA
jgi:adenosylcobinamide-GDP ribazoletransferase